MYLRRPSLGALLGHFVQVVHVAAVESQQSSEFGEQDARAGADARAGPGDQSHFAPQGGHLQHTLHKHIVRICGNIKMNRQKYSARAHTETLVKFYSINSLYTRLQRTFFPLNASSTDDDVMAASCIYPSKTGNNSSTK